MYSLPEIRLQQRLIGDGSATPPVVLPCPLEDLISLATATRVGQLKKLLRRNPALFVLLATTYARRNLKPPRSIKKLAQFAVENAAEFFADQHPGWSQHPIIHRKPKLGTAVRRYVVSERRKSFRKSLVSFLRSTTSQKHSTINSWVDSIVHRKLAVRPLMVKDELTYFDHLFDKWFPISTSAIDVESVFCFRQAFDRSTSAFDQRLHQAKMDSLKQLAYGASHEINNPLANIATRAQTLMAGEADWERKRKLAVIYEQAIRAHEMISDMMLFAHPPKLQITSLDVRLLVSKLVKDLQAKLVSDSMEFSTGSPAKIELQIRINSRVGNISADATQLTVALKAMLENAIEAVKSVHAGGKDLGTISLRVSTDGDFTRFVISDNGEGISAATSEHVFDPFFSGREAGRGLGFGLSKAWRIAQLHGGDLGFDREFFPGAEFTLTLPSDRARTIPLQEQKDSAA